MTTTYDITLRGLKRNQVMDIVDALPKGISFHAHRNEEAEPESKLNGDGRTRRPPTTRLSMTGKTAAKGSIREQALVKFEKLEAKHGIGKVTRQMFRDELNKMDCDKSTLNSLITAGLLRHLED